jgi:XrtJ-associated TM-motif-TM protein
MIAAIPAHAQGNGGCEDSPENPTLILAGLAGGAYAISNLRTRIRARKAPKNQ